MNISKIKSMSDKYLLGFYKRFDLAFVKGEDVFVYDLKGEKYLDFTSGIGVVNLGHSNRKVVKALIKQAKKIMHTSNLYYIPSQPELARLISSVSFDGKTFFCNSGTEANEAAIKVARWIGKQISPRKTKIVTLEGSFHGRTIGSLSITGQEKYRKGFEPLMPDVVFVRPNDVDDLRKKIDDDVCAVFVEAVQGEGGVIPLDKEFVEELRNITEKHSALLIFDEVQTGIGRTGKFWGYQHYDVTPDAITMAKGLGNGFPIGAFHLARRFADKVDFGIHASTFGGNFLAVAAGKAVLKSIKGRVLKNASSMGTYLLGKLEKVKNDYSELVSEVRGKGLMIGVEMKRDGDAKRCVEELLSKNILTLTAGKNTLRILPPLTVKKNHIDYFVESLMECLMLIA